MELPFLGGLLINSVDCGLLSTFYYVGNAVGGPVSGNSLNLIRAFPTASDVRLFPIFTGRAFPTD